MWLVTTSVESSQESPAKKLKRSKLFDKASFLDCLEIYHLRRTDHHGSTNDTTGSFDVADTVAFFSTRSDT